MTCDSRECACTRSPDSSAPARDFSARSSRGRCGATRRGKTCSPMPWAWCCALAVYALFDRRRSCGARASRRLLIVAAAPASRYTSTPIVSMVRAYLHRNGQFPVLGEFRFAHRAVLDRELSASGATSSTTCSRWNSTRTSFPGLSFHEPVPDWRRYKILVDRRRESRQPRCCISACACTTAGTTAMYTDRFNRTFRARPGERRSLRIPLDDIRHGPRNRLMNMTQISDVTLFRTTAPGSQRLRLHSMRLE